MRKTLHNLMIAFGAAVLLHAGNVTVHAGFIAATVDHSTSGAALLAWDGASASTPSETPAPNPLELLRHQLGIAFSVEGPASTTGMTSNSVQSAAGPSSSATLVSPASTGQPQLVAWLGPEGKVWLPPPFLSGIFRPPRLAS